MKRLVGLLFLLPGCVPTIERAREAWYPSAEIVCRRARCPACAGRGEVACGPCGGRGEVRCTRCRDGTQTCTTCKGDGSHKGKPCKSCGGDGRAVCWTCGGDQMMACDTCGGPGRLHCLRPLPITEAMPSGEEAWPPGHEPK